LSEKQSGLTERQLRAVNHLAGVVSDGTDAEDCESEAVEGWSGHDPEFIAALNRARSFRRERLRAEVWSIVLCHNLFVGSEQPKLKRFFLPVSAKDQPDILAVTQH
jgi:hypothetical protein